MASVIDVTTPPVVGVHFAIPVLFIARFESPDYLL